MPTISCAISAVRIFKPHPLLAVFRYTTLSLAVDWEYSHTHPPLLAYTVVSCIPSRCCSTLPIWSLALHTGDVFYYLKHVNLGSVSLLTCIDRLLVLPFLPPSLPLLPPPGSFTQVVVTRVSWTSEALFARHNCVQGLVFSLLRVLWAAVCRDRLWRYFWFMVGSCNICSLAELVTCPFDKYVPPSPI